MKTDCSKFRFYSEMLLVLVLEISETKKNKIKILSNKILQ